MSERTKGGNVILSDVRGPGTPVDVGQPFEIEVDVSNGANWINPLDKDRSSNPANPCSTVNEPNSMSYCINVVILKDGVKVEESGPIKLGTTSIGTQDITVEGFRFTETQVGTFDYGAKVVMSGSNDETRPMYTPVNITTEGQKTKEPGKDPSSGGGGGDGGGEDFDETEILTTIIENPLKSGIAIVGGSILFRTAIESAVGGD